MIPLDHITRFRKKALQLKKMC